jgi:bifunctional DNA-binding transcriptional regulator/antitoxin component of YhaV-PrlF toxin-antitoxin module
VYNIDINVKKGRQPMVEGVNPITYELEVDNEGVLQLPEALRNRLGILPGDLLTLLEADNGLMLVPTRLLVPEITERISTIMQEENVTLADLLESLDEVGEELFHEQYGHLLPR